MSNVATINGAEQPNADTAPTLASSAMLVELSISCWAGRKKDKQASEDVTMRSGAKKGMAAVTKKLLGDCPELVAVHQHAGNVRNQVHYAMTLPWSNSGMALLTTQQYFQYKPAIGEAETEFFALVETFLNAYDWEVSQAQAQLGSMFNPDEYPTVESLRDKFRFSVAYMPLPTAGDFRVDIGNQQRDEIVAQYETFYSDQLGNAMGELWRKLYDQLSKMSDRLGYAGNGKKNVFRDSLIENMMQVVALLRTCNVTGDSQMAAMATKLEETLQGVTPKDLRDNTQLRGSVKAKLDVAIKNLPGLDW